MHIAPSPMTPHTTSTGTPTSVKRAPISLHIPQNVGLFLSKFLGQEYLERITAEPARLGPQRGCVCSAHAGRCGLSSICQLSRVVSRRQKGRRKTLPREGPSGLRGHQDGINSASCSGCKLTVTFKTPREMRCLH